MTITPEDFQFVSDLVRVKSAIVIEQGKEYLIDSRLTPLARSEGFASLSELVRGLRHRPPPALEARVVEAMTTNETSFFRDLHPFQVLRDNVLPSVMQRRASSRRINIWSAACSTGQEALSIAMTMRQHVPELAKWNVQIYCTDLCTAALDRAKAGLYRQLEVNRGLPAAMLMKYFSREGNDWRAHDDLRAMFTHRSMNLIEPWPVLPEFDIVFLRNVLIYFDVDAKKMILERMRRAMAPQGFLFLGGAETVLNLHDGFQRNAAGAGSCYQVK